MKLSPLKIGFGISILCHVVALGFVSAVGAHLQPPTAEHEQTPNTLTLIAGPEEPATPTVSKAVVAPVPVQPTPPPPVETKPAEPVAVQSVEQPVVKESPVVQPKPSQPIAATTPTLAMAQPASQNSFRGDGNSIKPGRDTTTVTGEPGVKAKPNYLKNPEPPYPDSARRRHQEGVVILSVTVTEMGNAENVRVKESSHFQLLDQAASDAVRNWSFEPGRIGARAVESEIEVPVRFQLGQ